MEFHGPIDIRCAWNAEASTRPRGRSEERSGSDILLRLAQDLQPLRVGSARRRSAAAATTYISSAVIASAPTLESSQSLHAESFDGVERMRLSRRSRSGVDYGYS